MKTYEIKLKRTSYVTLTIEADSKEEAVQLAWVELNDDSEFWKVEYIKETK